MPNSAISKQVNILESESGESGKVHDKEKQAATFAMRQIRYNTGGLS